MSPVRAGVRDADTLVPLYHRFRAAHYGLSLSWDTYRGLFLSTDDVRELIDASGANFFSGVAQTYLPSILLELCRLTDPAKTGKYENLTLERLIDFFEDDDRRSALRGSLENAVKTCEFARVYRNKVIAHQDFLVAQFGGSRLLPFITTEGIDRAIAAIDHFLCDVEEAFAGWRPVHVGGISIGGYEILLRRLWEAKQWRQEHPESPHATANP